MSQLNIYMFSIFFLILTCQDMAEILLKLALNTNQSINFSFDAICIQSRGTQCNLKMCSSWAVALYIQVKIIYTNHSREKRDCPL